MELAVEPVRTVAAPPSVTPTGRIRALDGIRGLAISMVIVWHYVACIGVITPGTWKSYALVITRLSWSGVDLFFVLSGFLIGGILLDAKDSKQYFRTFYTRRFCRIVPAYAITLCAFGMILAIGPKQPYWSRLIDGTVPVWAYPLFLQNLFMAAHQTFGPELLAITWSLAVEEQFYLLLPAVVRVFSTNTILRLSIASFVFAPVIRACFYLSGNQYFGPYVLLPCRADALATGLAIAVLMRHPSSRGWISGHAGVLRVLFAVFGCGVIGLTVFRKEFLLVTIGYSWLAIFYGLLLLIVISRPDSVENRRLSGAILPYAGTLAYGIYLFHQPINAAVHGYLFGSEPKVYNALTTIATIASLTLTVLVAAASWRWMESPLIRMSHRRFRY